MTDGPLKIALVLDPETQAYRPAAHNLSASQAIDVVEQSGPEQKARAIDQGQLHRSSNPLRCKACKKTADEATRQHNESPPEHYQPEQGGPSE
jgi:hypothetical protein